MWSQAFIFTYTQDLDKDEASEPLTLGVKFKGDWVGSPKNLKNQVIFQCSLLKKSKLIQKMYYDQNIGIFKMGSLLPISPLASGSSVV